MRELAMPLGVTPDPELWNQEVSHRACVPAAGGIMSARDGARLFALLANGGELDGVRLLSEERLLAQTARRADPAMVDEMLGAVIGVGIGGYWLGGNPLPPGVHTDAPVAIDWVVDHGPHVLVSNGAGGSIAWANLDTGFAAMITHNRMFGGLPPEEHPFVPLGDALRQVVGQPPNPAPGARP
jgi:CubicO group peptidase (beta-lactamase class C family)